MAEGTNRLVQVALDDGTVGRRSREVEHERAVAIFDLLEENLFRLTDGPEGPYDLLLGVLEGRLIFKIRDADEAPISEIAVSLGHFRRLIRDYFVVCESYFEAVKTASPSKIEAIDMGRRAVHNEAAEKLVETIGDRVEIDLDTARRLFTLICVLHAR